MLYSKQSLCLSHSFLTQKMVNSITLPCTAKTVSMGHAMNVDKRALFEILVKPVNIELIRTGDV